MWAIAVVVVIIIAVAIALVQNNKDNSDMSAYPTGQQPTPTPTPATGEAANLTYNQALEKYGTNRIQFNAACQTTPSSVVYKAGTMVMFDNRSAGPHTITFNGSKYTLAGYGFKVLAMTASKYPATILVDCDKSQNVATILIQK